MFKNVIFTLGFITTSAFGYENLPPNIVILEPEDIRFHLDPGEIKKIELEQNSIQVEIEMTQFFKDQPKRIIFWVNGTVVYSAELPKDQRGVIVTITPEGKVIPF
jgi:hypothetical protein